MTFTREVSAVIKCAAIVMFVHCTAASASEPLPPPTELSHRWTDPFTVSLAWSWQKPSSLPDSCVVSYNVKTIKEQRDKTSVQFYSANCFTENGFGCMFTVETETTCGSWTNSKPVEKTIEHPRELVRDFKCFLYNADTMNCSWVPANLSLDLTVSYRVCSSHEKPLHVCEQPYSSGMRKGCYLSVISATDDICILVNETSNAVGWNTFKRKPSHNVKPPPPKFTVTEEGDYLNVNWTHPDIARKHCWDYIICYRKCHEPNVKCDHHTDRKSESQVHKSVSYDDRCQYEFQIQANLSFKCGIGHSDISEVITYGADKQPDRSLTVVVIVIPVILSICIILSCYCFKRHSAIICPIIPDPSVIFKEMMNVNKEAKVTTGSLYVPVPEAVEPCKITLATENGVLQQNS